MPELTAASSQSPGTSSDAPDNRPAFRIALLVAAAMTGWAIVRWAWQWSMTGNWVWRRFADDAYYYFTAAYNIAQGNGSTVDGLVSTNGYHPLWMILLLGPFSHRDRHVGLAITHALVAVLLAVGVACVAVMLIRLAGRLPALMACTAFLFPPFVNVLTDGMESALSMALVAAFAVSLIAMPRARWQWLPGLLLGFAVMARLDNVFLLVPFELLQLSYLLAAHRAGRLRPAIGAFLANQLPVLFLSVFVLWNVIYFGHSVPISGTLKSSFPLPVWKGEYLSQYPEFLLLLMLAWVGFIVAQRTGHIPARRVLGVLAIGNSLHLLYTVFFLRWAVFDWDFAAYLPAGLLGGALIVREAAARLPRLAPSAAAVAALALLPLGLANASAVNHGFEPPIKATAEWVAEEFEPDAILAMKDSGLFTFFSERRVMNLDGLVNSYEYSDALCEGRQAEFMERSGVEYLVIHVVPEDIAAGDDYETLSLSYPCHIVGGKSRALTVRRADEVYRGPVYYDREFGRQTRPIIYRFDRALQPPVQPPVGPHQ